MICHRLERKLELKLFSGTQMNDALVRMIGRNTRNVLNGVKIQRDFVDLKHLHAARVPLQLTLKKLAPKQVTAMFFLLKQVEEIALAYTSDGAQKRLMLYLGRL